MASLLPLCLLALALNASANPVPVPTPPPVGATSVSGESSPGIATCTTTLTNRISGFGNAWQPEVLRTVYTSTETAYARVPCHGCALYVADQLIGGIGPAERVTGTTTAAEPYRTTKTICSAEVTGHPHGQIPRDETTSVTAWLNPPAHTAGCTHTKLVPVSFIHVSEKTRTVYTTTATTTSHIDCAGCNRLAVSTLDYLNPGPVIHFTTTVTAEKPTIETEYVCRKTPSVVEDHSTRRTLPIQPIKSVATLQPRESTATDRATHPHPTHTLPDSTPPPSPVTVFETITKTIYTATVTSVQTRACGPVDADGPPGAIPRRAETTPTHHHHHSDGPLTHTQYSTIAITAEGTWTHHSFHCSKTPKVTLGGPYRMNAGGGVAGQEQQQQQQQHEGAGGVGEAAKTTPPPLPPSPTHPTRVTSTVTFPLPP